MTRTTMNDLAVAQTFVLGSALIVTVLLTLEWVERRRTRFGATRQRLPVIPSRRTKSRSTMKSTQMIALGAGSLRALVRF